MFRAFQYEVLNVSKIFVEITVEHYIDGKVRPPTIKWEDGRVFQIDRILDV